METPAPEPSRVKTIFRRAVFVLAVLITVGALLMAEENWRGNRAWHNYKSAMEAKGERFDAARLIPPQVPDNENFAACEYLAHDFAKPPEDPEWTNIADYLPKHVGGPHRTAWPYGLSSDLTDWAAAFQGETVPEKMEPPQAAAIILDHLKVCEPVLAELRAASQRRYCRFKVAYEDWANPNDSRDKDALLQQFATIKGIYRVLFLHAEAEMAAGKTEDALEDINLMFRLDAGLKQEPLLISQLVRTACMAILLQPVAEGLAEHRWSDAQLKTLQEHLEQTDLLSSTVTSFHGERDLCANPFFNSSPMKLRGWDRLEQLNLNRAYQEALLPRINLAGREVNPSVGQTCDLVMSNYQGSFVSRFVHHRIFAGMLVPALFRVPEKVAAVQTDVDLLAVACALERYRLAQGTYPDQLKALSPSFITTVPHDIINGQPLKYRRTANGKFILYSIGWNEKDDGGVIATAKAGNVDPLHGDWVLQYPE
jgi:hypothetical protein